MSIPRNVRTYMRIWILDNGRTFKEVAKKLEISERLLDEIISGGYTHPTIARRIQNFFRLTDEEINQIISPNRVKPLEKGGFRTRKDIGYQIYTKAEQEYAAYKDHRFERSPKA